MNPYFSLRSHGNLIESIIRVALPSPPIRFDILQQPFSTKPILSINWDAILTKSESNEDTLNETKLRIANELSDLEQIEQIYFEKHDNIIRIWTIINNPSRDLRRSIYEKESNIMRQFNRSLFDFNIITREGKSLKTIASFDSQPIFKRY